MKWRDLHSEIAELFGTLDGRDRYEERLEIVGAWAITAEKDRQAWYRAHPDRRKLAVERSRAWRKANPEKARALGRTAKALAANKRSRLKHKAKRIEAKRRWVENNRERARAAWRRNSAAHRARKVAAAAQPQQPLIQIRRAA